MGLHNEDKRYETLCQQIIRVARAHARHHSVELDQVEDCVMSFLAWKLKCMKAADLSFLEVDEEQLKRQADSWARHYKWRLCTRRRRESSLCGPDGSEESGPAASLASKEPGPEEVLHEADFLDSLLAPLPELTHDQQRLFVRHFLDEVRLVDLQEETGRTSHALRTAVYVIRKRLQRLLDGEGMDGPEIADHRSLLAGLRVGVIQSRHAGQFAQS